MSEQIQQPQERNQQQDPGPYGLAALVAIGVFLRTDSVALGGACFAVGCTAVYGHYQGWWPGLWLWLRPLRVALVNWVRSLWRPAEEQKFPLEIYETVLGRNWQTREWVRASLAKMQSVAVWGVTGSGKTTILHSLIYLFLKNHTPDELKIAISDLKDGLDFGIWGRVPHLFCPIAQTSDDTYKMLRMLWAEKQRRAELFKRVSRGGRLRLVNDLDRYHKVIERQALDMPRLPRIVVFFDEVSAFTRDNTAVVGKSTPLDLLISMAETCRAYGIHLVCSTQFPKVESIPRLLKEQLLTRIVGQMASVAAYYQVCDIHKEVYETKKLETGEFFASIGGAPYFVLQGHYVPDRELERLANELSQGVIPPQWTEDAEPEEPAVAALTPWEGSREEKLDMLFEWFSGFDEMPTPEDFTGTFDASRRTYYGWIPEAWSELKGARTH